MNGNMTMLVTYVYCKSKKSRYRTRGESTMPGLSQAYNKKMVQERVL